MMSLQGCSAWESSTTYRSEMNGIFCSLAKFGRNGDFSKCHRALMCVLDSPPKPLNWTVLQRHAISRVVEPSIIKVIKPRYAGSGLLWPDPIIICFQVLTAWPISYFLLVAYRLRTQNLRFASPMPEQVRINNNAFQWGLSRVMNF